MFRTISRTSPLPTVLARMERGSTYCAVNSDDSDSAAGSGNPSQALSLITRLTGTRVNTLLSQRVDKLRSDGLDEGSASFRRFMMGEWGGPGPDYSATYYRTMSDERIYGEASRDVIGSIKYQLNKYGEAYGIKRMEGRLKRGLDPAAMLALAETRGFVENLAKHFGADMADVIAFTNELHQGGMWRNAQRLQAAAEPAVCVWLILASFCVPVENELSDVEFLLNMDGVLNNLEAAIENPKAILSEAITKLITNAKNKFTLIDGVPYSEADDGHLAMAFNGHGSGIVKDANGLLFVGADKLDYDSLKEKGLKAVQKTDQYGTSTHYVDADGNSRVKVLGQGFAIVFGGALELAKFLASTAP